MEQDQKASAQTRTQSSELSGQKKESLSIPLAIVFAGLLVAAAIVFSDKPNTQAVPKEVAPPTRNQIGEDSAQAPITELALRANDHIMGNPDANVLIIEYSDTECPFCKRFHETMMQIMNTYGKTGSVAWVYRHFPLDQLHPKARNEAQALECASELGGNEAFWKYLDKLFEVTPSNNGLDPAQLPKIAQLVGLNPSVFTTCLASNKYAARVDSDYKSGVEVGAHGTPYSIAYNKKTGKQMTINGALAFEQVKTIVGIVGDTPTQQ